MDQSQLAAVFNALIEEYKKSASSKAESEQIELHYLQKKLQALETIFGPESGVVASMHIEIGWYYLSKGTHLHPTIANLQK